MREPKEEEAEHREGGGGGNSEVEKRRNEEEEEKKEFEHESAKKLCMTELLSTRQLEFSWGVRS